jgi:crotonobetainyl-CoA:carnitine CoA-transferase CaiB-like acyl-CoA transferase
MSSAHQHDPATAPHPLEGTLDKIRVVDFTQIAAGPLCTMLLADMGAEVIKVEPPGGDIGRTLGPPFIGGESAVFLALNRNKRSVVIDLKTEAGRQQARKLIATADVLVESYRPGVADRLGIGFRDARAISPNLIYCSISAYGQSGPWSAKPGVDGVLQAVSGLMSITGADGEPPSKLQVPVVDMVTGYHATIAVLAALHQCVGGKITSHIDINLFAGALMLQQVPLSGYLTTGDLPRRSGSGAPYATPNEAYETADGHILIAAYQSERWQRLCACLGRPELAADPRFASLQDRMTNRSSLTAELNALLRRSVTSFWIELLENADIICAPVADYQRVANSPQLEASGLLTSMNHPTAGEIVMPGFAIGGRAMPPRRVPPLLGEHNHLLAKAKEPLANSQ